MKTLVAYYSRTGTTRKVAQSIADSLKCDVEEIVDKKDRNGPVGYVIGGRDAMKKSLTEIETKKDPAEHGLVVIGTPVWAWTMCHAIRTYLTKFKFKKVAFFCTMGGSGAENAFKDMEELCRKKPAAVLELKTKEVNNGDYSKKIDDFVKKLIN